ncbi:transcription initiation factor IIA subunit 2-like [Sycon ciliatum]|uniref:transcription initiation factor IIA subunit 2-like n=1 Tax=Sycon ciliatum TaxID=27933 RepID=UPI0020AE0669|eukprot:scpid83240/ scgid11084/ Transcription initiation factor IIA subunit 2; General transcription factor IIA subunit 2; Transcription initiation factor IIA gamma chain
MSYQLYRNTTLGHSLQECLDELIQSHQITPALALQVLLEFDKAISKAFGNVKTKSHFKGSLRTYRFCDNVWTFVLSNVAFKEGQGPEVNVDKVKIVACDAKGSSEIS